LHGYLREQDIAPVVERGGRAAVQHFVDLANERGGKDNITVVLVELD
jgi:protein phosphatase